MNIVFFGTPSFVVPVLRALATGGYTPITVITAPDKPVGRKKIITASAVKTAALELGITVLTPNKLKDEAAFAEFAALKPDLCIVAAYNKIFPASWLAVPRLGFLNIHPSLLPLYRGPSPVRSAILDGQIKTGVSIMVLDEQMDHGPLLAQQSWPIPSDAYAPACEDELFRVGSDLLLSVLPTYVQGTAVPTPQDYTKASVTHTFTRQDGRLDWSRSASELANQVRALADSPGTWTTWQGKMMNILTAHAIAKTGGTPGMVIRTDTAIGISCQDGILIIEQVQPEGGKAMSAEAFANGHPEFITSEVK